MLDLLIILGDWNAKLGIYLENQQQCRGGGGAKSWYYVKPAVCFLQIGTLFSLTNYCAHGCHQKTNIEIK